MGVCYFSCSDIEVKSAISIAKTICAQGATEVWHDLASFDMIWHVMGLEH